MNKVIVQTAALAASDMSASTQQYMVVKVVSGGVGPLEAATDKPLGVLLNRPKLGEVAEICHLGLTKIRAGAADLAVDALLTPNATGGAVSAVSGNFMFGRVHSIANADNDGAVVVAAVNFLSLGRASITGG